MSNDWSHGIERAARESDCHVAALLSSALIARESTHLRISSSAISEAANAVHLYRCVLAALLAVERSEVVESLSPTGDSAAMQMLDVSRDGHRYRYQTYLYDKLDDALNFARIDRERERDREIASRHDTVA